MKCKKCGHEVDANADFCTWCGTFTGHESGTVLNGIEVNTQNQNDVDNASGINILSHVREREANINGRRIRNSDRANINGKNPRRKAQNADRNEDPGRVKSGDIRRREKAPNINGDTFREPVFRYRMTAFVAYLGWAGFIIACLLGHRQNDFVRFHLNAALMVNLFALAANLFGSLDLGYAGIILSAVFVILAAVGGFRGIVAALTGEKRGIRIFTSVQLIK